MENNRGQSIFLSVVGIATLLVAIVGATFAYFSIIATGNETASSIHVTTAQVGNVTFNGTTAGIEITDAYPGWTDTKTFTVTNSADTKAGSSVVYQIYLCTNTDAYNSNDGTKDLAAAATADSKHEFVYSLSGNGTGVGSPVSNADMPSTDGCGQAIATGTLTGPSAQHTWTFKALLKETGSAQNYLQGKSYHGTIQVVVADEEGLRTWDGASGWTQWTDQYNVQIP